MSSFEIISDYSKANLTEIPEPILDMVNLKMLFLEKNCLVKLPDNFFYRLPNLMWLDLRNNQLEDLPKSVAHHEHLEHLLLTNNSITKLPNELGLVINLKALQVADNPLVYPPKKVIQEGTKSIKKFLKEQYEIECAKNVENQQQLIEEQEEMRRDLQEKRKILELQEEKLIQVHEKASEFSSKNPQNVRTKIDSNRTIELIKNHLSDPNGLSPTLRVKKIDCPSKKPVEEPMKIVHNVSNSDTKICLKSYYQKSGSKSSLDRIPENALKEGWLNKLRILLNDQEKILQQERNLRALSNWRQRKLHPPRAFFDNDFSSIQSEPPYATYAEYSKIPSRSELAFHLQTFLKDSNVTNRIPEKTPINLDKVINDLMQQLKEMETNLNNPKSPRSEMEYAGKQIQMISDIHKKLLQLKSTNNNTL